MFDSSRVLKLSAAFLLFYLVLYHSCFILLCYLFVFTRISPATRNTGAQKEGCIRYFLDRIQLICFLYQKHAKHGSTALRDGPLSSYLVTERLWTRFFQQCTYFAVRNTMPMAWFILDDLLSQWGSWKRELKGICYGSGRFFPRQL